MDPEFVLINDKILYSVEMGRFRYSYKARKVCL